MADYAPIYGLLKDVGKNQLSALYSDESVNQRLQAKNTLASTMRRLAEQQASDTAWKSSGGDLNKYLGAMAGYSPEYAQQFQTMQKASIADEQSKRAKAAAELDKIIAMGGGTMQSVQSSAQRAQILGFPPEQIQRVVQIYTSMPDDGSRQQHAQASVADYDKWYAQQIKLQMSQMPKQASPMSPLDIRLKTAQAMKAERDLNAPAVADVWTPKTSADLTRIQRLKENFSKDRAAVENAAADADMLIKRAQELSNHPGLSGNFGLQGKVFNIPGSNASDAATRLEEIKNSLQLAGFQALRASSGSPGVMTEREWPKLEASIAMLQKATSVDEARRALSDIQLYANRIKQVSRDAFNEEWSNTPLLDKQPSGASGEWRIERVK